MKKIFGLVLCLTMMASLLVGCSSKANDTSSNKAKTPTTAATTGGNGYATNATYAIIVKSAGNPYNQKQIEGYKQVIEENGGKCVIQEPKSATAEDQITCINNAIAQGVDCIAIAANDTDALEPALIEAKNQGIHVLSFDSSTNANSRKSGWYHPDCSGINGCYS